jgi:hypothetical protein
VSSRCPASPFALGANALQLAVTDAGGLSATVASPLTRVAQTQADAVLQWIDIALQAIQRDVTDPPVATRTLALLSLAQYDTAGRHRGHAGLPGAAQRHRRHVGHGRHPVAAHRVLASLVPGPAGRPGHRTGHQPGRPWPTVPPRTRASPWA